MLSIEILTEWNPWWIKKPEFNLIERELTAEVIKWANRKEIIAVLGVRRAGKTSLMYLVVEHLLSKINPKNILFIKCDDDRVDKNSLIHNAIELYREHLNPKGRIFVFIDEVQETLGWESTLKRIYDLKNDTKIFISGSNFSILKDTLSYKLAGRLAYFDLYPFSFKEIISQSTNINNKISILSKKQEIKHNLLKYIEFGGFPEITLEKDKEKKSQLLRFYYDSIVYRDIIKRQGVRNPAKMEKMINYFLQNISNPANFSKVGKTIFLSTDSIGEYVKYLQDAFFMFSLSLFSPSVKKQEINPKKIYCVDTGIRNIKGFRFSEDYGRLAENIVFVELKRRNCTNPLFEVFYWRTEKNEIDFVVKDGLKVKELIQVCWDIENPDTKKREINALLAGCEEFKLKEGLIITTDKEGKEIVDKRRIKYIPLWKWLLEVK